MALLTLLGWCLLGYGVSRWLGAHEVTSRKPGLFWSLSALLFATGVCGAAGSTGTSLALVLNMVAGHNDRVYDLERRIAVARWAVPVAFVIAGALCPYPGSGRSGRRRTSLERLYVGNGQ
jgi:hypothetical protein